jgi:hypothetical protein
MASVCCVFSVELNANRVLSLVSANETFLDIIKRFTTDISLSGVSCSTNGCEWTSLTTDIVSMPVNQVMESFAFKFIRIDKKLPEPAPVESDLSGNVSANRDAFELLMAPRKRRLPNKKTTRYEAEITGVGNTSSVGGVKMRKNVSFRSV